MRAFEAAKAEADAFAPVFERISARWQAGRPSMDMIHWKQLPFADRYHTARVWDLDQAWQHHVEGEGKWWGSANPAQTKARYRAALDPIQAFRDAEARHNRESGMDDAEAHDEALSGRLAAAERALMQMPAPDLPALRWKLERLHEPDGDGGTMGWSREWVEQTRLDVARLMVEA